LDDFREQYPELKYQHVMKKIGAAWQGMTEEEKQVRLSRLFFFLSPLSSFCDSSLCGHQPYNDIYADSKEKYLHDKESYAEQHPDSAVASTSAVAASTSKVHNPSPSSNKKPKKVVRMASPLLGVPPAAALPRGGGGGEGATVEKSTKEKAERKKESKVRHLLLPDRGCLLLLTLSILRADRRSAPEACSPHRCFFLFSPSFPDADSFPSFSRPPFPATPTVIATATATRRPQMKKRSSSRRSPKRRRRKRAKCVTLLPPPSFSRH
jgi:hypothetical protein